MNTSAGYYQAPRPPRVPLDEVLIKLHPEGFHQAFEADGINVGPGGISMRASVLPQVGSMLRCQLDNPPGGEAIQMIGRVVWAHESGEHAGEFGIRFTHLSDQDQMQIEALIQRWGRRSAKAPTVRLQLDGVESPIVAELKSETESALTVEQPLPFLAIGSGMRNENAGRRGHLEAVELRMEDQTPKLILSIGYEAIDEDDSGRDTMPDAPPIIRASSPSLEQKLEDTPRIVRYDEASEEPARTPLLGLFREHARFASDRLGSAAASLRAGVSDRLVPRIGSKIRELTGLTKRFIAALRARIDDKPRRKQVPRSQAARAHLKNTRRNGRRYVMLAALVAAIVAAGWGIYLWAAGSVTEPAEAALSERSPKPEKSQEPAAEPAKPTVPTKRVPPAADTTATTEIAIQGAPLPPEPVRGTSFGAKKVPDGEKYVLRMSNPVTDMEGIMEDDGFSVTIPGSLSLSRAGPIASAHPDVEHASILNRGDFSELTVRFVAGRRPPYRVDARGPAVELTIAR